MKAGIKKHWLGWSRPILHSTVDYLLDRYRQDRLWDLDSITCVLPSSMATRRLQQLLAERAFQENLVLRPPTVITSGQLPEELYEPQFPFASELEQLLCWTKVLRAAPSDFLKPLLIEVPSTTQTAPWVELASLLSSLHRELSSDLTLFSDVAERIAKDPTLADEADRWRILAKLQRDYLDLLSSSKLWDIQTARRVAIKNNEASTTRDLIVIAAVDLYRAQRRFLEAVADRVTVLIGAPETWREGFDEYGTLKGFFWEHLPVELDDVQLVPRATANEAADEVGRQLAYLEDQYAPQQITVGVPDPTLIPLIKERLDRIGVRGRYGAGINAGQTSPVRLLQAINDYLAESSFESLAVLVRLPAVFDALRASGKLRLDFVQEIDRYHQETLLSRLTGNDWPRAIGIETLEAVVEVVEDLLKPLRLPPMKLQAWSEPLQEVLRWLFGDRVVDLDSEAGAAMMDACSIVGKAVAELGDLPESLMLDVTFSEATTWIVRQIDKTTIPPLRDPTAVELIGWLDLTLDDAPVLLLTGIHDGTVPESVNADAFLPNRLRSQLGLMDNTRRYARDSYSMHVHMRSRKHFRIVTNHHSLVGDPQTPSRLLLAVEPGRLSKRVLGLVKPMDASKLPSVRGFVPPRPVQSNLPIPKPIPGAAAAVVSLSPSDFQSYIACPYRFYLKKILRLKTIDDRSSELEANAFGTLLHETLAKMDKAEEAKSTDAETLRVWLFHQFNAISAAKYGKHPAPVIVVQLEQARQRLAAFAAKQAQRNAEGWTIWGTECEIKLSKPYELLVSGQRPMPIIGRIDRIDFHPQSKQFVVWDYKTGDTPADPVKAHWTKSNGWKQLQLPLYAEMVRVLGLDGNIQVGYIVLPRAVDKVDFKLADFSTADSPDPIAFAGSITACIRNEEFWPPNFEVGNFDDFSAICQTNVARRWDEKLEASRLAQSNEQGGGGEGSKSPLAQSSGRGVGGEGSLIRLASSSENTAMAKSSSTSSPRQEDLPPDDIAVPLDSTSGKAPREWFDRTLIEASAGTGKTYSLAVRMLRLLFAEQSPEGILATTFTRKAAGEILERVLEMLANAIESASKLQELSEQLKPLKINRQACIHHLSQLCSQLHRLRVNTLDGFYSQLARSFALELRLPPGWTLASEFEEEHLVDWSITRMFEVDDRSQLRSLISQMNRGEAKRGIRQDILQTIGNGYQLFRLTNREAWSKVPVPTKPTEPAIRQALAEVERSKMDDKRFAGTRDKLIAAFVASDWEGFFSNGLVKNFQTDRTYNRKPFPDGLIAGLDVLIQSALSDEIQSRRLQTEAAFDLLAAFHSHLEIVKRQRRLITFSDVSLRLAQWFRPESERGTTTVHKAGFRLDAQIEHLLLDEFQDTSPTQWDILAPFAEAVVRSNDDGGNTSFFCVGDIKQAIYGWRGGSSELFKQIRRQLMGIQEQKLLASYRSSSIIIDFVNKIFKNLRAHENFGSGNESAIVWSDTFPEHSTKKDLPGYVRIRNASGKSETKASYETEDGEEDEIETSEEILERCVADIVEVHRAAPGVSIGVLVRTNAELTPIIHRLRELGIEASQEGGNPLDDSAAVELILSAVQLADHPGDSVAEFHLRSSPLAMHLQRERPPASTKKDLADVDKLNKQESAFVSPIDAIAAERWAVELRRRFDEFGYGKTVSQLAGELARECSERDQTRLDQLVQAAYTYDAISTLRHRDFVDYVRTNRVALNRPAPVRVMTIHQSKGLEFDAVFLPGMSRNFTGRPPVFLTKQSDPTQPPQAVMRWIGSKIQPFLGPSWQEAYQQYHLRAFSDAFSLFYVALTRARQAIYFYGLPHKKPVKRWDSLLVSILAPEHREDSDAIIYEHGDADWYRSKQSEPIKWGRTENVALEVRLKSPSNTGFARQLDSLKPSAAHESRTKSLKQLFEKSESTGAVIGTAVHRWFEEIIWIDDFKWDREAMRKLALQTIAPEEMPLFPEEEVLSRMEEYLRQASIGKALSKDRYADWKSEQDKPLRLEVANERALLQVLDGKLLRGTIDRLVLGFDGPRAVQAEILDYKTDAIAKNLSLGAWCRERIEHHGPQLKLYRRVLCEQFNLPEDRISLTLILLNADRLIGVEN
jgi:ATP-dependent exoDNAse (exonuclease V) beta subunit